MITLKNTICSVNNCSVQIDNVTGFKSLDNPGGFLIPGDVSAGIKDYFIDDVYIFTFMVKNSHLGDHTNVATAGNIGKIVSFLPATSFDTLLNTAKINQLIVLTTDGYYSIYQLAIPKESIKSEIRAISISTNYYVKPDLKVYTLIGAVETEVDLYTLITSAVNLDITNIVVSKFDIISQCYLQGCFNFVLQGFATKYMDQNCLKTDAAFNELKDKRDMLFAVINTIQYYIEFGQYYKAAKLINDVSFCSVCKDYIASTTVNCNCHG